MVAKISGQCMRRNKDIYRVSKYLLHKTLINYKEENSNSLAAGKKGVTDTPQLVKMKHQTKTTLRDILPSKKKKKSVLFNSVKVTKDKTKKLCQRAETEETCP